MKLMSRILLLLSVTVFLGGCKLAVIVVEGGAVWSDSSGICLGGTVCIVDVASPNFQEVFTAVPDEGWYFQKWNAGDRFFCGGSTNPTCKLSFNGVEDNKEIINIVASSEVFYLMPVFRKPEIYRVDGKVIVDDKEWLQPKDFVNYSYDQVSAVCPGGICSGPIVPGGRDLTGYIWASSQDVKLLSDIYTQVGRNISEDFERTAYESNIDYILYAMLSDPPQGGIVIGASAGGNIEIIRTWGGPISITGVWFWRPRY